MGLAIHLLGTPRVERDGAEVPAPRGRKVWGLLAYLVLSERPAGRAQLAGLLFADADDPLGALRWNLSELRRLLGLTEPGHLRGDALALPAPDTIHVDVKVLVQAGWAQAVGLPGLGCALLEGMSFGNSPAFDVWLATQRRRLEAATESVLREAAMAKLATGAAADAVDLAGRLVGRNPLDERYQALFIRTLAAAGNGAAAARQVAACRDLFRRELGVLPGPEVEAALRAQADAPLALPRCERGVALAQLEAGQAAINAGALSLGLQCLRRAVTEADSLRDAGLRARSRLALGAALVHAARGRDDEGAGALHEALAIGESVQPAIAAAACRELGYVEFLGARYDRAQAWLERALPLAGDDIAEQARIAIVRGGVLTDTAHYADAVQLLRHAHTLSLRAEDTRQAAYAASMLGRALLLQGELQLAREVLGPSVATGRASWTSFLPWPLALLGEADLLSGDVDVAAQSFDEAFALGCHIGDPCWEAMAARGLAQVAIARGDTKHAVELLVDAVARAMRLPDAYLWVKAHALDLLCGLAVAQRLPQAAAWVDALHLLASRTGMRELAARALLHRGALGDRASGDAGRVLARAIDNPVLQALADQPSQLASLR